MRSPPNPAAELSFTAIGWASHLSTLPINRPVPMIRFRCWKCHRKYSKADEKIGRTFTCSCTYTVRVPKVDNGNCRVKTLGDRLVEAIVCGGGCAFLGFCFAVVVLGRMQLFVSWQFVAAWTIGGGLAGIVMGERAIDFIGDRIRERERD